MKCMLRVSTVNLVVGTTIVNGNFSMSNGTFLSISLKRGWCLFNDVDAPWWVLNTAPLRKHLVG